MEHTDSDSMHKTLFTEDSKMLKHKKFIWRGILLIVLIFLFVSLTNRVLIPKYYFDQDWPTTSTFIDFYKLEENTVDVLFFGSSHSVSSFSPQKLYDEFSIRSYNLSSEQQNLLVSYYWLKEALKYQTPKAVVLDTYILYPHKKGEALNSDESTTRKALDFMRWSKNKIAAIEDVANLDEKQSKVSYYFTNIRFHTRWKELSEDDFTFLKMEERGGLKGFSAFSGFCMSEKYVPFKADASDEEATMHPVMKEYLDRIVQLCKAEGITLILTKTPSTEVNIKKYNTLMKYSEENEITYIDYNEELVYQEAGFNYSKDSHDIYGHLNIWGAEKATEYMGKYLIENVPIEKTTDIQWESSSAYYADIKKNCDLTKIEDIGTYLHELQDDRYTVFLAVKDDGVNSLNDEIKNSLRELGLTADFDKEEAYQKSYYAVLDKDGVTEEMSEWPLEASGSMRNGREWYKITSEGYNVGNDCSIIISGNKYAQNLRGFNIVVYDNDLKKVIDSVVFDTHDVNLTAKR